MDVQSEMNQRAQLRKERRMQYQLKAKEAQLAKKVADMWILSLNFILERNGRETKQRH
jgi:hypothetical protein